MPRIEDRTVNSPEYWAMMYKDGKYPTLGHNQKTKFSCIAPCVTGKSVLDVGCGECGLVAYLDLSELSYIGMDYGKPKPREEIDVETRSKIKLIHADARVARWPKADTVVLSDFIEHFDRPMPMVMKAAAAARKRVVVCLPKSGLFTKQQNMDEHFWDFSHDEVRLMLGWIGTLEGPFEASFLCDLWYVTKETDAS